MLLFGLHVLLFANICTLPINLKKHMLNIPKCSSYYMSSRPTVQVLFSNPYCLPALPSLSESKRWRNFPAYVAKILVHILVYAILKEGDCKKLFIILCGNKLWKMFCQLKIYVDLYKTITENIDWRHYTKLRPFASFVEIWQY